MRVEAFELEAFDYILKPLPGIAPSSILLQKLTTAWQQQNNAASGLARRGATGKTTPSI
ncbi:response regulatory protein ypdB [Klebsiella pneumoniae]|uniref:Response regulatory protein ypdB n=1 Tax=Klebsiella pneumoniae TaxID=573 RepID=A0A377V7N2_KLEPN|nr:response regulatory protein ypdB [Klebsiella pneumoniae]